MISGAHAIIYSKNPEADRTFLRDIIGLPSVDVGGGWLIFGLPPTEVAFHPSETNNVHELFFMCENISDFVAQMMSHNVSCSEIHEESWGRVTEILLPGGGTLGVYEPKHERPSVA